VLSGSLWIGIGVSPALAHTHAPVLHSLSQGPSGTREAGGRSDGALESSTAKLPATTPEPTHEPRIRVPIGPIVSFVKSAGPAVWNSAVKAAKAGWAKTVQWWNSLAGWLRAGIKWIANVSAESILQSLIDWILHH